MTQNKTPAGEGINPPASSQKAADRQQQKLSKGFWKTVRRALGQIPFMADVIAAYYCALDQSTPFRVRATLTAALAYFVLPLDAVPDFLVGVGFTDDAAVLLGALNLLRLHIKPAHREAAARALRQLKQAG